MLVQFIGNPANNTKKISILETEQNNIILKKDKLLELSLDGSISNAEFKKRNDVLNLQYEKIESEIEELKRADIKSANKLKQIDNLKNSLNAIFNSKIEFNSESISTFVETITVNEDFTYKFVT